MQAAMLEQNQNRSLNASYPSLGDIVHDIPSHILYSDPGIYWDPGYSVLDFEIDVSHGDFGHPVHPENQMLLAVWTNGPGHPRPGTYVCWGGEFEQRRLVEDLEEASFLIAHNAKYELGWLHRCGFDVMSKAVFDTKLAEYVMSGNLVSSKQFKTSLDACCRRRGLLPKDPVVDTMMRHKINPVNMPRSWLEGRCRRDVSETLRLFEAQREELQSRGQAQVHYTRCLLTPVLTLIELNGMQLDADRVSREVELAEEALLQAQRALQSIADINWNSGQQVADKLYGDLGFEELKNRKGEPIRTATDRPKTDKDTVEKLKAVTPEQKAFKVAFEGLNRAQAALSKNLRFFQACCEHQDGRIHFEFNQARTSTHRLASNGIPVDGFRAQGQNLPNRFKALFTARKPGALVAEWDGSGLEFRGAGLLSKDKMILSDINGGRDPHAFSGSVMHGTTYEEFMERKREGDAKVLGWRKAAKAHTFKPLFGGQSGTRAEKKYYTEFNKRYSDLAATQKEWSYAALGDKRLRTPWGLVFYFPEARMERDGYINVKTKAYNYPIQSISTAEIIPLAVVFFAHMVHALGLQDKILLVNTIHDSVICEVDPDVIEVYKDLARKAWLYVYWYFSERYGFPLEGLPLGTEITYGSHWTEGQSEAYNIYQDGRIERDE